MRCFVVANATHWCVVGLNASHCHVMFVTRTVLPRWPVTLNVTQPLLPLLSKTTVAGETSPRGLNGWNGQNGGRRNPTVTARISAAPLNNSSGGAVHRKRA